MSDPMTNSEVEDVLSSIRRLVSDEKRSGADATEQLKPRADRLVLTPSLRVSEDSESEQDTDDMAVNADTAESARDDITDAYEDAVADASKQEPLILNGALEVANTNEGDLPDTTVEFEEDTIEFTRQGRVGFTVESPGSIADASETLGAKIAALETLISGRAEEWEPDQAGAGENAGTKPPAMNWEEPEIGEKTAESIVPDRDSEAGIPGVDQGYATPDTKHSESSTVDAIIDPDVLRELVSDIVRQELQGPLGERITRNVRKLVRRELHRALTSKDLE